MHWFTFDKDRPGEIVFRFPWLPMWMNYNPEIPQKLLEAARAVVPKGLDPESVTEDFWDLLDHAAATALEKALPYVSGVGEIVRALSKVKLDESKAPKGIIGRPLSEVGVIPPGRTP